jgi:hypothetical protein
MYYYTMMRLMLLVTCSFVLITSCGEDDERVDPDGLELIPMKVSEKGKKELEQVKLDAGFELTYQEVVSIHDDNDPQHEIHVELVLNMIQWSEYKDEFAQRIFTILKTECANLKDYKIVRLTMYLTKGRIKQTYREMPTQ